VVIAGYCYGPTGSVKFAGQTCLTCIFHKATQVGLLFLILAAFYDVSGLFPKLVFKIGTATLRVARLLDSLYVLPISTYPLLYLIRNGIWL